MAEPFVRRPYGTPITEAELKLLLRCALKADPPAPRRTDLCRASTEGNLILPTPSNYSGGYDMDAIDKALDNISRSMFGMTLAETHGMLKSGDYDALDKAFAAQVQRESDRLEARRRVRDANEARTREAAKTVAPTPYKHVTIAGAVRVRQGGKTVTRPCPMFVTGLSWGDGMTITKVSFSENVDKAHRFSSVSAADVAGQLARRYRDVRVAAA